MSDRIADLEELVRKQAQSIKDLEDQILVLQKGFLAIKQWIRESPRARVKAQKQGALKVAEKFACGDERCDGVGHDKVAGSGAHLPCYEQHILEIHTEHLANKIKPKPRKK